jgi:methylenetetrahydrofolate reductase (NADPH)
VVSRTSYSFEFFPPKDVEGEERLWAAIEGLKSIAPDFVSVTYGAGGSTRDRSIRIAREITQRTGISTVAHLTCVGSTRDELIAILHSYKEAGIKSILALRGDPTGGPSAPWNPTPGGFNHADELVQLADEFGGFTIGVAAFPDGHPASKGDFEKDVDVLIRKEELGATFATTQFFFEAKQYNRLVEALAARGSKLVIIPGILPVTNVKLLHRMAELGGTPIPGHIADAFAQVENDPQAVRALGVEIATSLCQELLAAGAPGLHFYTMNSSTATQEIYQRLNDVK